MDYFFGFIFTVLIGVLIFCIGGMFVVTHNYNTKPCDWFIQNNWRIGETPSRCTENIFKSIEQ